MEKYTFIFGHNEEQKFRGIRERLEPNEYTVVTDIFKTEPENRDSNLETVMTMEPEAALTFRLGMSAIKIHRERPAEEEAAYQAKINRHKIRINVQVPMGDGA